MHRHRSISHAFGILLFALGSIVLAPGCSGVAHRASAAAAAATTNSLPPGTVVLRRATFKDEESGLTAYEMLAPTDWKTEGQVTWHVDRPAAPASFSVRSVNAANSEGFTEFPTMGFAYSEAYDAYNEQLGGKMFGFDILAPPDGAESAIRDVLVPKLFGDYDGLEVRSTEQLPNVADAYAPMYNRPGQPQGTVDAAKARIDYTEDGVAKEGEIVCVFVESSNGEVTVWALDHISFVFARKGSLDAELPKLDMIALSLTEMPKFSTAVQEASQALVNETDQDLAAVMERAQIRENASQQISADEQAQWEADSQARSDAVENYDAGAIRGVVNEIDPSDGSVVQVPDDAAGAWSNGSEIIWSSDPSFKPSMYDNTDWQQLQPAHSGD